jgi:hypothetical protein
VLLVCTVYSVLYSEIALSRKPFGIGHMYIHSFLLRMADTMTTLHIDLSACMLDKMSIILYLNVEILSMEIKLEKEPTASI